jgi:hypothetical protein
VGWPIIGSLHLLGQYEVPFEAFSQLSKMYGDIFSITLGSTPCVVVNSFKLIKEVLITKGPHFGGRPNFIRYDILFGGDRDNCKFLLQKKHFFWNFCIFRPKKTFFKATTFFFYFYLFKFNCGERNVFREF